MKRVRPSEQTIKIAVHVGAFFLLCAVTAAMTYPFIFQINERSLTGDTYLNTWIMEHHLRSVFSDPEAILDQPIFHPFQRVATYTDTIITATPFYALFRLLGAAPLAAQNLMLFIAFVLPAFIIWLLCREGLNWSWPASLLAALLYSFSTLRLSMVGHLQTLWHPWLVLLPLILIFYYRRQSWLRAAGIGLMVLLQFYSSIYLGLFTLVALGLLWLFIFPQSLRSVAGWKLYCFKPVIAVVVALLLAGLLLFQYYQTSQEYSFQHPISSHERNSISMEEALPDPRPEVGNALYAVGLLDSRTSQYRDHFSGLLVILAIAGLAALSISRDKTQEGAGKAARVFKRVIGWLLLLWGSLALLGVVAVLLFPFTAEFFSGINDAALTFQVLPLLAVLYLVVTAWEQQNLEKRVLLGAVALAVFGLAMALGPRVVLNGRALGAGLEALFYHYVPGMTAFRVTYRWLLLALLGFSLLAGYLFQVIMGTSKRFLWIAGAATLLIHIPSFMANWPNMPPMYNYKNPAYSWLGNQTGDVAILELPFHDTNAGETRYMLGQLVHNKRLVNGYSGFIPDAINQLRALNLTFPGPEARRQIRTLDISYLVVHVNAYAADKREAVEQFVRAGDQYFNPVFHSAETAILAVNGGASGKLLSMHADADANTIQFNATSRKPLENKSEFCTVYLNGKPYRTIAISSEQKEFRWQIENPNPEKGTEVTFRYHYTRGEPALLAENKTIPFDLEVESGGRDPNRFHVGINGGLYPGEKGINLYHIDRQGLAVRNRHFNTSYFTQASGDLIKALEEMSEAEGYLLIAVRFDAARSLTMAAQEKLKTLRLNTRPLAIPFTKYIALIDLESGALLAQRHHAQRVVLSAGTFDAGAGFSITDLKIQ